MSVAAMFLEFEQYRPMVRRSKTLQHAHTCDLFVSLLIEELSAADVVVYSLPLFLRSHLVKVHVMPSILSHSRSQPLPGIHASKLFANQSVGSPLFWGAPWIVFRFVQFFLFSHVSEGVRVIVRVVRVNIQISREHDRFAIRTEFYHVHVRSQRLVKLSFCDDVGVVIPTALRVDSDQRHRSVVRRDSSSFESRFMLL